MTATTDLTDRDRLSAAFDELRQRGYLAPIEFAWTECCRSCAMAHLERLDPEHTVRGHVFWHVQADDDAFIGQSGQPLPERLVGHDDEWYDDRVNEEEVNAALLDERLHRWTTLRGSLWLQWGGDRYAIVRTLRRHGLDAHLPPGPEVCIEVRPSR